MMVTTRNAITYGIIVRLLNIPVEYRTKTLLS